MHSNIGFSKNMIMTTTQRDRMHCRQSEPNKIVTQVYHDSLVYLQTKRVKIPEPHRTTLTNIPCLQYVQTKVLSAITSYFTYAKYRSKNPI